MKIYNLGSLEPFPTNFLAVRCVNLLPTPNKCSLIAVGDVYICFQILSKSCYMDPLSSFNSAEDHFLHCLTSLDSLFNCLIPSDPFSINCDHISP